MEFRIKYEEGQKKWPDGQMSRIMDGNLQLEGIGRWGANLDDLPEVYHRGCPTINEGDLTCDLQHWGYGTRCNCNQASERPVFQKLQVTE